VQPHHALLTHTSAATRIQLLHPITTASCLRLPHSPQPHTPGEGRHRLPDGTTYTGQFAAHRYHGAGAMAWPDGSRCGGGRQVYAAQLWMSVSGWRLLATKLTVTQVVTQARVPATPPPTPSLSTPPQVHRAVAGRGALRQRAPGVPQRGCVCGESASTPPPPHVSTLAVAECCVVKVSYTTLAILLNLPCCSLN
jgi:hypothetical protein